MDQDIHVILVAFTVRGDSIETAHHALTTRLPRPYDDGSPIQEWWVAEDQRFDGSDNDAAVFVPNGMTQFEAYTLLDAWASVRLTMQQGG